MKLSRRSVLTAAAATTVPLIRPVRAQRIAMRSPTTIKIGVLNDQSGPYKNTGGRTSVACVDQAVEEFASKGFKVEVVNADHRNKADLALSITRAWFDHDGVDLLIDVPNSSVALALQPLVREKNKVYINSGAASSALTGAQCSPNFVHWTYDTYMLARSTGSATEKAGGDSWYFVTADYAFGQQLQADTTGFITAAKGSVKGASLYPFPGTTDFSSFLVQAKASGANVLGLANAGADTVNSIKQAHQVGLGSSMRIAALLMFITDVHALGLDVAGGMNLTESFYWDMNDRTRAWTKRVLPRTPDNYPNMEHAGCYSGALHYLKTVAATGVAQAKKDGVATVNHMKAMPVEDDCFGKTRIRKDGRNLVPSFLFEVKQPSESKGPWDYYKLVTSTPGDKAFRPLSEGHCPFVRA
jgi:branched-chain amino acid transport system substrate-binding protein